MTTVNMVGLSAAFELVTLRCKWEVLEFVCCVRLGTACYSEVWRTVGRYRDTNHSDTTYRFLSQGREVGTVVTEYSKLNVTGNVVTHK